MAPPVWVFALALGAPVLGALGALGLKLGAKDLSYNPLSFFRNRFVFWGLAGYGLASVLSLVALKFAELSFVYPMAALSYVFVALLSQWFLGERMNAQKWLGILLIIAGVTAIGFGSA